MLRITFAALFIFFQTLFSFAQHTNDSSRYTLRKLKLEEVNFVSSYYHQEGNNSAVTGGIGTEKLTDLGTTLDVKLSTYDSRKRKHTLIGEFGVDVYTSASSDKIDPYTISSASTSDVRVYPSITYSVTNDQKRTSYSIVGSVSTEYDYLSKGIGAGWSKLSKDKNREFAVKAQAFLDTWSVILPIELRSTNRRDKKEPRNSYSTSFTLSQIVSKRMQLLLLTDFAYQSGQLATLYHRTYFNNGSHQIENLPDQRFKFPVALRVHYFAGDRFILRSYYRYYQDSWGLQAHTFDIETPIKITPFFSLSPFYRYYTQQGVKYFAPYQEHSLDEVYYTSDYDLSTLSSQLMGMGIRLSPPGGILGISKANALELRYGHYTRSTGLTANTVAILIKIK
ncbi:DUF3570 domain-containing protein [Chryseotalea sanaruensis]|uniref:DUF3570 domain-containing protein n=1 Tax=Chryseotalea sanaruensis TaxID=2482724 RepID=A0A401U5P5_9BACT|nr:DUF3570 domain-containing protein [Chryseotalea sanaruensis]GCC50284.1 DUF3570 domain-containing protein [Chryseotalea sanaruensis]